MSLHAPDVRIKALAPQPSKWSRSQCVEQINKEYKITVEIKDLNTIVQKTSKLTKTNANSKEYNVNIEQICLWKYIFKNLTI